MGKGWRAAGTVLGVAMFVACLAIMVYFAGMSVWRVVLLGVVFAGVASLAWGINWHVKRRMDWPDGERWEGLLYRPWVRFGLALSAVPLYVVWTVGFGWLVGRGGGSLLVQVLSNLHMGVMFFGVMLASLAFARGGKEPRCARCQYLLEGAPEGGYDVCPECGEGLRATGTIVTGHKTIIKPMLITGIVLVIAGFATMGRLSRGSPAMMPYLPTGALIEEVTTAPRGFTSDEWQELLTRTLTPQETQTLFEGMLDLRDTRGYYAAEAEGWLDQTAMAGAVPADLVERYYAGMLELWLAGPEVVRRGDAASARFGFGGDFRGNLHVPTTSTLQVFFVPESLMVGGQRADMENDPRLPIYGVSMNTTDRGFRRNHRDPATPSSNGPTARLDASLFEGDTIELRGTGWLYVAPHGTPMPTGSATPAGAVWARRVDVSKTVRIED